MRGYPRNRLTDHASAPPPLIKRASSRGYGISYQDAGAGHAVVLVPGWTMSAADWFDAGYVDRLARRYRVLNVDPLGNGLSDKPHEVESYRQHDIAADVLAVLQAEGIAQAGIWGYSRGAWLAATVAATFPGRISALILGAGSDLTTGTMPDQEPGPVHLAMADGDFQPLWEAYSFSDEDRRYDLEVNDPRALGAMSLAIGRFGESIDLTRVAAPALVYTGSGDEPEQNRATADALRAEMRVLPGLDHLTAFSAIDVVMPVISEFLDRVLPA